MYQSIMYEAMDKFLTKYIAFTNDSLEALFISATFDR